MTTEPFRKISKKLLKKKKRWHSKVNTRNANFFSLVTSLKNVHRQLYHLHENFDRITTPIKDEHIILGSPLDTKAQAGLLENKIDELEKVNRIVGKLDARYCFYVEKLLQSAKVVVLPGNQCTC